MHVIIQPARQPDRRVAIELLVRVVAIAVVTLMILGLLPAIIEAAA
jgi:hypothetical protein